MEKAITMSAAAKGKQIVQQQCEESTLTTAVTTDTENKVLAFLSSISCKATDKNYVGKDEQMEKHEDSVNGVIDDVLNLILASHTTERVRNNA